ncbi:MAG TPA: PHP domain-containing protein [Actinomycetota bacterium]|jgi:3',5'-nucleoside bisphosphate phosphatase|nr:PHP domain-containing protein [Actinomycetota bacterium]
MPRIDLHAHSNRSDGTFAPAEVVRLASERDLDVVALTDHDTTDGLDEALATGAELGVEVVPGIELSAEHEATSVHVLCYWMDPANEGLQAELSRLGDERFRRGELMVEKLRALGVPIEFERVQRIANGATIVRPHVAQAMVEIGAVATEKEAFDVYLGDGRPGHVPKHALDPVDAVALILGAGGVCVLAHPGMWGDQTSVPVELIKRMAAAGMRGLEVDHPDHLPEQVDQYRALAGELGLVATGGSDCHGTRYEPVRLGTSLCRPEAFDELRGAAVR